MFLARSPKATTPSSASVPSPSKVIIATSCLLSARRRRSLSTAKPKSLNSPDAGDDAGATDPHLRAATGPVASRRDPLDFLDEAVMAKEGRREPEGGHRRPHPGNRKVEEQHRQEKAVSEVVKNHHDPWSVFLNWYLDTSNGPLATTASHLGHGVGKSRRLNAVPALPEPLPWSVGRDALTDLASSAPRALESQSPPRNFDLRALKPNSASLRPVDRPPRRTPGLWSTDHSSNPNNPPDPLLSLALAGASAGKLAHRNIRHNIPARARASMMGLFVSSSFPILHPPYHRHHQPHLARISSTGGNPLLMRHGGGSVPHHRRPHLAAALAAVEAGHLRVRQHAKRTLHGRGEGERATPSLLPSSASWPVELDEDVLDPGAPPPTVAELRSMIRAYYESWRANGGSSKDDIAPLKRIHHCFNQLWAAEFGANEASGLQAGTAAKEGAAGFTVKSVAVEATAAGKTDASGDDPGTVPPESLKSLTAGEASCILTAARRGVMSPLPLPRAERRLKRTIERLDQLHGADVLQLRKFHTMLLLWHSYPGEGGRFNRAEAMLDAAMREGTWHPTQMTRDLLLALYCIEYGAAKGLEWLTEKEGGWQVMVDLRAEERGSWFETEKAGAVGEKTWKPGPIKPFKRTVFTYAELVKAFVAENKIDNALRCVKSMREEGLSPDCIIWTVLTKAYVYRNDLASAERCFDAMIASGIKPHRISYESIIYGLLNLTRPRRPTEDARRKDSSTSPAAIAAKERRGVEKAMALFNQMVDKDGMKPGVVMYYQFLNLHFRKGDLEKVKELFASMQANGVEPDQYCYTSLLQTYMEEVRPDRAEKLLAEMMSKGMEKNIFVYSILMHGYARAGDLEKALATYREMRERGIYPTYQCMCILLYAHCYNGDITGARLVMEEMRDSGMVVGLVAYNTLMQGLGIAGDLHAAGELYYDMMRHAIQPAVTTYNTLISAHLKAEDIDGAMRWYDSLLESGEEPTLVTFNLLVKAQAQRLNVMGAMEVVQRLRDRGHTPDAASLAPIVTAHVARSEWAEARWIAREMKGLDARGQLQQFTSRERGVVGRNPTAVANTFIKGHTMGGRLGEALREYEVIMGESVVAGGELIQRNRPLRGEKEMQERLVERGDREQEAVDFKDEKVLPDVRTFDMIIRAFGIMGDTESAERWMEEALKRDNIRPDTRLYNALLQGYVYKGDSEGAVKTYNAIMARGLHPDIFTYTLLFKAHERNRYLSSRKAEEDAKEEDVMDPRGGQVLAEAIGLAAGVVDSSGSAARADSDDGSTTWISEMEGESEGGQL